MKHYEVEIMRDTHEMIHVEVDAESEEQAEEIARDRQMSGEYDDKWDKEAYPDVRESFCAVED